MSLPHPLNAYVPRTGRLLRSTDQLAVELGPVEPVLFGLVGRGVRSVAHKRGNPGSIGRIAAVNVVNLMRSTSAENRIAHYSGKILVAPSGVSKLLLFSLNDLPGVWAVRAKDLLGGATEVLNCKSSPDKNQAARSY
jgi:hypothetical protein